MRFPYRVDRLHWNDNGYVDCYLDRLHGLEASGRMYWNGVVDPIVRMTPKNQLNTLKCAFKQSIANMHDGLQDLYPSIFANHQNVFNLLLNQITNFIDQAETNKTKKGKPKYFRAKLTGTVARCSLLVAHLGLPPLLIHYQDMRWTLGPSLEMVNLQKCILGLIWTAYGNLVAQYELAITALFHQLPIRVRQSCTTRNFLLKLHRGLIFMTRINSTSFARLSSKYRYMGAINPAILASRNVLDPNITDSSQVEVLNLMQKRLILGYTNNAPRHDMSYTSTKPCMNSQVEAVLHSYLFLNVLRCTDLSQSSIGDKYVFA